MTDKRAMLLSTTVVLVLMALLIASTATVASKFIKTRDNSDKLDDIANIANNVLNQPLGKTKYFQTIYIPLKANELFMFFSSGVDDIKLVHPTPVGSKKTYYGFIDFKRPKVSACDGTACVCYCKLPVPPRIVQPDVPDIKPRLLFFSSINDPKPFTCEHPVCRAINSEDDKAVLIGNSRGSDDFTKLYMEAAKKRSYVIPIPMRTPLLAWSKVSKKDKFELSYLKTDFLVNSVHWENGVVIGGMDQPTSESDVDNHVLRPVPITLKFESYPDAKDILGICSDVVPNCLLEDKLKMLKAKKEQLDNQEFVEDQFLNEKIKLNIYLKNTFNKNIENLYSESNLGTFDETEKNKILSDLFKKLNNFFSQLQNPLDKQLNTYQEFNKENIQQADLENSFKPELEFEKKQDGTILSLYYKGSLVDESGILSILNPIDENGKPLTEKFIGVDPASKELIMEDGSRKKLDISLIKVNGKTKLTFVLKEPN